LAVSRVDFEVFRSLVSAQIELTCKQHQTLPSPSERLRWAGNETSA